MTPVEYYMFNNAGSLQTPGGGLQACGEIAGQLNQSVFDSIFGDLLKLSQSNANQAAGNLTAGNVQQTWRVFIRTIEVDYKYVNDSSVPIEMDIYDFVSKKDIAQTPTDLLKLGLTNANILSQTADSAGNEKYIGAKYSDGGYVSKFYSTKKVTKVTMLPGMCHKHTFKRTVNKWVSRNRIVQSPAYGGATPAFGGLTSIQAVCLVGYPALETGTTIVTTDRVNLPYSYQFRVGWQAAPFEETMIDYQGTIPEPANTVNIDTVIKDATLVTNVIQAITS